MGSVDALIVAPHPDDESIGCGGTIASLTAAGERIEVVFLTSGENGVEGVLADSARKTREQEADLAAEILGLSGTTFLRGPDGKLAWAAESAAAGLAEILSSRAPSRVYVPHPDDAHPDHGVAERILASALEMADIERPWLIGYEVWTPMARPGWISDISTTMPTKLRAIRAYRSQLAAFRYDRAVSGLNAYRGELGARKRFAEALVTL